MGENIYPTLPNYETSNVQGVNPTNFRLQQISEIKKYFESEIENRKSTKKKYKKAFNTLTGLSHTFGVIGAGSTVVSMTSLANLVTAPVGFALGGIALVSSCVAVGLTQSKNYILKKLEKHEKITTLAISKLNTINDLVSKSLTDGHITQEEYTIILGEKEKYTELKNAVRNKAKQTTSDGVNIEEMKKTFLEEGKKLAQSEMITKLTKQD